MRVVARAFAAAFLFLSATSLADSPRHVDELLRKSGIWKQAGDFPALVKSGAEEVRAQEKAAGKPQTMTDAEHARFVSVLARAFSAERMRRIVSREIQRDLPAEDEARLLKFLSSDLGVRTTKIEEDAASPGAMKEIDEAAEGYFAKVPGARIAKLTRLARAVQVGDSTASMMIGITSAIAYGAAASSPNGDQRAALELRRTMEAKRPELAEAMYRRFVKIYAYMYRSLPDEDLDAYVEFAQTPAARHFTAVTIKAFDMAFQEGGLEIGRYIGRESGKHDRAS